MNEERKEFHNRWKSLIRGGMRYAHHHHISLAGYSETTLSPSSFMDLNNNNNNNNNNKQSKRKSS